MLQNASIIHEDEAAWREGAVRGLAFADGFLGVDGNLRPHDPSNRALWGFLWPWEGPAELPSEWSSFFGRIWENVDEEERYARSVFLGCWYGSALLGVATKWAKVLILPGSGANGKSVLLSALSQVLPPSMRASVPPQLWEQEYFRHRLRPPTLLNAVAELPEGEWFSSEWFKSVTAGDLIPAREPYGKPMFFHPALGHVFSMNELPPVSDRSQGFWRRVTVMPLDVVFTDRADRVPADELVARLCAPDQQAPFLRWAIQWALKALEIGELPPFQGHEERATAWQEENDPVQAWARERLKPSEEPVPAVRLYQDFSVWADERGMKRRTIQWWGRNMKRLGFGKEEKREGNFYFQKVCGG